MADTEGAKKTRKAGGRRTVAPDKVRTLRDWVARWPGAANLAFDPEERNPVIYSVGAPLSRVKEIPWKREADTLTVLTQRESFASGAVAAAERRVGKYREQQNAIAATTVDQLRLAETALLETWRIYHSAAGSSGGRSALLRDVVVAERALRELEAAAGKRLAIETMILDEDGFVKMRTATMPRALRGMDITEVE